MTTPWAVICREHGQVFLTEGEYILQLSLPDQLWTCPICGNTADWDDNWEDFIAEEIQDEPPF